METKENFLGYELKLKSYDNKETCIQIYHNKNSNKNKNYTLNIKEPRFLSHTNIRYAFYFANVSLSLIRYCKETKNKICSDKYSSTNTREVGIKSGNTNLDSSKPFPTGIKNISTFIYSRLDMVLN